MAFSPETYALLKAQGGGGGSSLPTPSAANVGQALVVKPKLTTIVPQQTVTVAFVEELDLTCAVLSNVNLPLFVEGTPVVAVVNGVEEESAIYNDDGWLYAGTEVGEFDVPTGTSDIVFAGDEGTYTVALYKKSTTEFEYGLQLLQMEVKFDPDTDSSDKTLRDVSSALSAGARVFARIPVSGTPVLMTAVYAGMMGGDLVAIFNGTFSVGSDAQAVKSKWFTVSSWDSYLTL